LHATPAAPGFTFASVVQSWLQAPQFVGSDARLTHLVVQRSGVGVVQLDEQVGVPVAEQSPVGLVHVLPHWPQFDDVVSDVSQPSSARVEQWPKPLAHAAGGTEHAPATHWTPEAPGLTLGSVVQSWPHVPQFRGSPFRSTHDDTQRSGVGATQLLVHVAPELFFVQTPVAPVHFVPQVPQLLASVRLASQPSSARDEQWP
jgi:hypothetical protein